MKNILFTVTIALFAVCVSTSPVFAKSKTEKIIQKAEQGDIQAQYELATMYEQGKGAGKRGQRPF